MLQRMPHPYRRVLLPTAIFSLVLTVAFLFLPLAGTDLSAQVARGHFVQAYGLRPVDFRWYGGIFPFGYSLLTGPLNALIGSRGVGAVGSVVGAVALAFLLVRGRVRRPLLGAMLGAACLVCNLISGRTTFALGVAFGLLALAALALPTIDLRWRLLLAGTCAVLSTASSPVAGLFLGLAGAALLLTGHRTGGFTIGISAALPMVVLAVLFHDGGIQPFSMESAKLVITPSLAVLVLVPPRYRAVRMGALLTAVGLFVAFLVPSPIGYNAARLTLLFAVPLVAATAELSGPRVALSLALICWWQPPLVLDDLGSAGSAAAHRAFYQPLIDELHRRAPVGRVEVVPLHDHWESTYVADAVPIARGWERQVDVGRNPLFYGRTSERTLTSPAYLVWLYDNAVTYVAVPRHARLDQWGQEEKALIDATPPYLQFVWGTDDWQLYHVDSAQPLVSFPAKLVSSTATGVIFDMPRAGAVVTRVQWSRWTTLRGPDGCVTSYGRWTVVRISKPGRYELTSGWHLRQAAKC